MIFPQNDLCPSVVKRYQPIAGPFPREGCDAEFEALYAWLQSSGARVLKVGESRGEIRDGVSIYRLRSDCETIADTRRRLRVTRLRSA